MAGKDRKAAKEKKVGQKTRIRKNEKTVEPRNDCAFKGCSIQMYF